MTMQPANITPGKRRAFRIFTLLLIGLAGICIAESALRWRQGRIDRSDKLAPGMIQYDAELGWKLAPGWKGPHTHHDYQVSYSINALGFRNDAPLIVNPKHNQLTVVVGDSFTFGLGVNDDATFVHRLNAKAGTGRSFSNAAVPGFSTDQQALLIEKRILAFRPDRIVLVVYVGNDFFDNQRAFPLQVSSAKPYFELSQGELLLRNSPVPMVRKPADQGAGGLLAAVWGPDPAGWPLRTRLEQQSDIVRVLAPAIWPEGDHRLAFTNRTAPATELFGRILKRIAGACERSGVKLTVVTLTGRSFVEQPGSASGQYQDIFREQVLTFARTERLEVIDVASQLKGRFAREKTAYFYPNEGHLNPAGHQAVAEILAASLGLVQP